MSEQQWEEVLGRRDLAGLVLEAARRGGSSGSDSDSDSDDDRGHDGGGGRRGKQHAKQAAHGLCLASAACRQAVLGGVERAAAPDEWAREHAAALSAMTALVSLRLTGGQGVDPAQLPPLPRLTSLECSLQPGAEDAAAWPGLSGLRQLALVVGAGGVLPPALLQLPHLTSLRASASSWDALRLIQQLAGLRALVITFLGEMGDFGLCLDHLSSLTSLSVVGPRIIGLPVRLGQLLASLRSLALRECHFLLALPWSLGQLAALHSLELDECSGLLQLPDSLVQLAALSRLHLRGCDRLKQLPASLGQLLSLNRLDLHVCSRLQQLPDSMGRLSSLCRLDLHGCSGLQGLPQSLGRKIALCSQDLRRR
jgi:hypothetical protein